MSVSKSRDQTFESRQLLCSDIQTFFLPSLRVIKVTDRKKIVSWTSQKLSTISLSFLSVSYQEAYDRGVFNIVVFNKGVRKLTALFLSYPEGKNYKDG